MTTFEIVIPIAALIVATIGTMLLQSEARAIDARQEEDRRQR